MDHPARYALVEVENVHDEGLIFEPIHRVLFGVRQNWKTALENCISARRCVCTRRQYRGNDRGGEPPVRA